MGASESMRPGSSRGRASGCARCGAGPAAAAWPGRPGAGAALKAARSGNAGRAAVTGRGSHRARKSPGAAGPSGAGAGLREGSRRLIAAHCSRPQHIKAKTPAGRRAQGRADQPHPDRRHRHPLWAVHLVNRGWAHRIHPRAAVCKDAGARARAGVQVLRGLLFRRTLSSAVVLAGLVFC